MADIIHEGEEKGVSFVPQLVNDNHRLTQIYVHGILKTPPAITQCNLTAPQTAGTKLTITLNQYHSKHVSQELNFVTFMRKIYSRDVGLVCCILITGSRSVVLNQFLEYLWLHSPIFLNCRTSRKTLLKIKAWNVTKKSS